MIINGSMNNNNKFIKKNQYQSMIKNYQKNQIHYKYNSKLVLRMNLILFRSKRLNHIRKYIFYFFKCKIRKYNK